MVKDRYNLTIDLPEVIDPDTVGAKLYTAKKELVVSLQRKQWKITLKMFINEHFRQFFFYN